MIGLPLDDNSRKQIFKKKNVVLGLSALALLVVLLSTNIIGYLKILFQSTGDKSICPAFDIKRPESFTNDNATVNQIIQDEKFRLQSVQKLAGAIKVDTQIGDKQPDVPDAPEKWTQFKKFHKYLQKTFPTVYENLEVETVNTYGLVFYWKGSNSKLKPVMLTAHQDTVPVQKDSLKDWTYPPFDAHYDGEFIYGRGAADCKNVLIAILESFELLLEKGFEPERGVIASFGFDEEASGVRGASNLGKYLEKKFGHDSIYAIIDEGPGLMEDPFSGQIVAMAGTGEKGYVDIEVELAAPGGHSSMPPDHTTIGIMSEIGYLIERDPFQPILTTKNPILNYLQCAAVHSKKMPSLTKKTILRAGFDKLANSKVLKSLQANDITRYLVETSQALDIIQGGEKANALPEDVKLLVNHRVAVESTYDEVKDHFADRLIQVAKDHGLGLNAFGKKIIPDLPKGNLHLRIFSLPLNPAPISPLNDKVWEYLAGVTRHIFEDYVYPDLEYPIVLTPGMMTGNTDTRYYWNLTRNIFRYTPFFSKDVMHETNIHRVDEKLRFDSHLQLLAFFYEYLQTVNTPSADNK
mmetsp:Transcript_4498/g.5317  ORF Transcript_4498/g.5317 Transcript_4498/m.5317 type:complete len:578 (+) Transcript_4498:229-1962(+)